MGAKACRCLIKDSRDESPPKTRASDTNPPGRQRESETERESENNEDWGLLGKRMWVDGMRTALQKKGICQ